MKKLAFLTWIFFALAVSLNAQNVGSVREIDIYVQTIKKLTAAKGHRKIIIADTADYAQGKSKWRRFASDKALDDFREQNETYSIAYNWKLDGKVVATNFTDFSPSGDWARYTFHYFRTNGSTAKVEVELRTFYGDYTVARTYYLNAKGAVIRKTIRYRDLTTGKPKAPTDEMKTDNVGGLGIKYYRSVNRLPFLSLLK